MLLSYRVDGREVKDVKAHGRNSWQEALAVFEGAVLARLLRGRAGKELVPCTEEGFGTVHPERQFSRVTGFIGFERVFFDQCCEVGADHIIDCVFVLFAVFEKSRCFVERRGFGFGSTIGQLSQKCGSFKKFYFQKLPCPLFLEKLVIPGGKVVDPGMDGICVKTLLLWSECSSPAMVAKVFKLFFLPGASSRCLVAEEGPDTVVTIGIDVCFDFKALARDTLGSIAAAIDLGREVLYDYPNFPFGVLHGIEDGDG